MYNITKKTCLGVLDREKRDDANETSLKEGGGTEIKTTVLLIFTYLAFITSFPLPCTVFKKLF